MLSVKFIGPGPDLIEVGGFETMVEAYWFGLKWGLLEEPRPVFVSTRHTNPAHAWLWRSGTAGARELAELLSLAGSCASSK